MSCRLVLFLIAILSFSVLAETTIKIPLMLDPILKITSTDESVTYIDEAIDMPWRSQEHLSYLGVPHDQDYSLTVYDNSGKMSVWRIDAEQDIVLEFAPGESPKHFTYLPILMGGTVNVIDVETDEVIYTTKTQNDGSWQFEYTGNIADLPEYVLIDMVGGLAMGKPRDPSNKMMAYVQSSDLFTGSVTTSIFTTAAYMSIAEDKHHLIHEEFIDYYHKNTISLVKTTLETVVEPKRALYWRPSGVGVGNEYVNPASEFLNASLDEYGSTMWDTMSLMGDTEQRNALHYYFNQLDGWGLAEEKRTYRVKFKVFGEGSVLVNGVEVALKQESPQDPFYSSQEIFLDLSKNPTIEAQDQLPYRFASWEGCFESDRRMCSPKARSGSVIILYTQNPYISDEAPKPMLVINEPFILKSGGRLYFTQDTDVRLAESYLKTLYTNYWYSLNGKDWFEIIEISNPDSNHTNVTIDEYYATISGMQYTNPQDGYFGSKTYKTNIDIWNEWMGDTYPYEKGVVIDVTPPGSKEKFGFFTSENPLSNELSFGTYQVEELSLSLSFRSADPVGCTTEKLSNPKKTTSKNVGVKFCSPGITKLPIVERYTNTLLGKAITRTYSYQVSTGFSMPSGVEANIQIPPLHFAYLTPYLKFGGTFDLISLSGSAKLSYSTLESEYVPVEKTFSAGISDFSGNFHMGGAQHVAGYLEVGMGARVQFSPLLTGEANIGIKGIASKKVQNLDNDSKYFACMQYADSYLEIRNDFIIEAGINAGPFSLSEVASWLIDDYRQYPDEPKNPDISVNECLRATVSADIVGGVMEYTRYSDEAKPSVIKLENKSPFDAKVNIYPASQTHAKYLKFVPSLTMKPNEVKEIPVSLITRNIDNHLDNGIHTMKINVDAEFHKGFGTHAMQQADVTSLTLDVFPPLESDDFKKRVFTLSPSVQYLGYGQFKFTRVKTNSSAIASHNIDVQNYISHQYKNYYNRDVDPADIAIALINTDTGKVVATQIGETFNLSNISAGGYAYFTLHAYNLKDGDLDSYTLSESNYSRTPLRDPLFPIWWNNTCHYLDNGEIMRSHGGFQSYKHTRIDNHTFHLSGATDAYFRNVMIDGTFDFYTSSGINENTVQNGMSFSYTTPVKLSDGRQYTCTQTQTYGNPIKY
tara:strand:+ start:1315 stop:4761 length:3447 start_codon:yes stop_codon:yes gene_type:complete